MSKKIVTCAIFSAVAIVVSSLERFVPVQAIIPLPGLKLGIANCIILFALITLDFKSAFTIMLCKCLVSSFLFLNPISFLYSFFGGLFALFVMYFLIKANKLFSVIGVSVGGALFFNIGQIVIASVLLGSIHIYKYLTILLPVSILTGVLTGIITILFLKNLKHRWK